MSNCQWVIKCKHLCSVANVYSFTLWFNKFKLVSFPHSFFFNSLSGDRNNGPSSWGVRGWRRGNRCHSATFGVVWTSYRRDLPAPTSRATHRHWHCHQPRHLASEWKTRSSSSSIQNYSESTDKMYRDDQSRKQYIIQKQTNFKWCYPFCFCSKL